MLVILTILLVASVVSNFIQIKKIKGEIVMALNEAVNALIEEVGKLKDRLPDFDGILATLEAERALHAAYVVAEDEEDVLQAQELADAKAATDAEIAKQTEAVTGINLVIDEIKKIAAEEEPVEDPEAPVDPEVPSDPEAPVEEV
jgi:hypothetical protein